jgi:hypothetical protein
MADSDKPQAHPRFGKTKVDQLYYLTSLVGSDSEQSKVYKMWLVVTSTQDYVWVEHTNMISPPPPPPLSINSSREAGYKVAY